MLKVNECNHNKGGNQKTKIYEILRQFLKMCKSCGRKKRCNHLHNYIARRYSSATMSAPALKNDITENGYIIVPAYLLAAPRALRPRLDDRPAKGQAVYTDI